MSWFGSVPVGLVCVGWLLVPGLLVTYLAGLRGLAAWATAPIVTVAEAAALAVVAGKLGVAWSPLLVAVVCLVVAVVTGVVAFLVRRRFPPRQPDRRSATTAAVLGLVPAAVLGAVALARGFGEPDSLSETFDAVFHYNAVAYILDSHNASSLTLTNLGAPGAPDAFYPGAWHDLVSLVVSTTGGSIPVATNLFAAAVALLAWPLSCVFLVRQIFGPSRAALAVTGVVSLGFNAYPWGLLSFGVLWPNLLGMALAPASLGVVLSVCGLAKEDALGRGRAWLLLPVVVVGLALAHPNVLFSLIALSIFPVGTALIRRALRRPGRGLAEIAVAVAVFLLGWWWAATTPALATVRTMPWPPFTTPRHAVSELLRNATNTYDSLWVLSALVLVGFGYCLWRSGLRWLVGGQLLSCVLYVLSAGVNTAATQKFTGYWYNDSHRLAAMVPITAVPLAVAAILLLTHAIRRGVPKAAPVLVASVLGVVLLAVTGGLYVHSHTTVLAGHYTEAAAKPGSRLVDDRERAFFARIKNEIPADARVAGNPWDGSILLWALADRQVLVPQFGVPETPDRTSVAQHLIDAATDPAVCAAADRLDVRYLLIGEEYFWPDSPGPKEYPGLADPGARPGFQLVDSDGPLKLYRLTAC
ncbi:hypothetical protein FHX82_003125 [Amycolatopsis bartoniae]|uniref:Uncharacterized protein n=1 Tax=Amycolatopsis bartoniae TaxID=941986 RepID=A0A8H9IX30_9PSEU|nr:DUF6541 family protein [Amycolatopsis bartoniae]MBB2936071.1 hypothetical protein [Amycolatopsis bartoniae]TVT03557.1 hypothetical protein FNH07_25335 [Amycolatopsis bartoniae]GHF63916.1 hypothetical protein GCM10017566_42010 [Amycolatopsis bartoniae]